MFSTLNSKEANGERNPWLNEMNAEIEKHFSRIEAEREELLALASKIDPEVFLTPPRAGKWPPSQVLLHLVTAEDLSVKYLEKKTLGLKSLGNSGLFGTVRSGLLKIFQRLPLKYKTSRRMLELLPEPAPIAEVARRWDAVRKALRNVLERFGEGDEKKKVFRHPIAGRLNILQTMSFFNEHMKHHLPQIERFTGKGL